MDPTEVLEREHRVIEQVLDCLHEMAVETRRGAGLDRDDAEALVEFLRTFADRCHHGKEEDRLFPAMERKGVPRDVGPISVMRAEHDLGRGLVRALSEAVRSGDLPAFADAAGRYVELLREHIAKEDGVLFPMARSVLGPDDLDALERSFAEWEAEDLGPGLHEEMVAIADRLTAKYGVQNAAGGAREPLPGCCCTTAYSATSPVWGFGERGASSHAT